MKPIAGVEECCMLNKVEKSFKNREAGILGNHKKSAVTILLLDEGEKTSVIFEVRSLTLRRQPGDICLPGGKVEKGETPREAAIRETMEELNLQRDDIEVIGDMDYVVTPYGFIMYPFVAKLNKSEIKPNREEVDHVFKVPLEFFIESSPELFELPLVPNPGEDFPYHLIRNGKDYQFRVGKIPEYFYKYNDYIIWGFTALIIKSFVDIIKSD